MSERRAISLPACLEDLPLPEPASEDDVFEEQALRSWARQEEQEEQEGARLSVIEEESASGVHVLRTDSQNLTILSSSSDCSFVSFDQTADEDDLVVGKRLDPIEENQGDKKNEENSSDPVITSSAEAEAKESSDAALVQA
ncbi:Oidioi.mRNA.OKI2018_I69.XSR.g16936.t1.cds [Oikopleura dioica]|uniref:Oidioi.mRNA.OKI2018_I69.XSR.g16936.t1.cds n=1 Tax=Oikopleura dioica TaxID=34765 RepID=A0ABN7SJG8_OIKDI|nr:Oidioi.mRNA.OKI2018_I69.XSR.g16936.t1.cds [Oikopleura dioica]